jgi:hypothetical protein
MNEEQAMNKPWFDARTGTLLLDDYVAMEPYFQKILGDGTVTDSELAEQTQRTETLLRKLEAMLPPEVKDLATEALCALMALYILDRSRAKAG